MTTIGFGQQVPPNAFNYSGVARDALGQPIASNTIGIQITIIQSSATGTSVYSENHFVNTDEYGLFDLIIGSSDSKWDYELHSMGYG